MIADYLGRVVGEHAYSGGSSWVAGTIDVHAPPRPREREVGNWIKDLTTEQYRLTYERPLYPKNLYAVRPPYNHDDYRREVIAPQVRKLQERGIYAAPDDDGAASTA